MTTREFIALEVPIDQLVNTPINVRQDVGDVSELADSIKENGVLEPLIVRPTSEGAYEVIIGSRRLAASRSIGLESIPVIVQDISDGDAIVRSLVENLQRGDLSLEERVEAYKKLQQIDPERFSSRGISRLTGRHQSTISQEFEAYAAMMKLRPHGIQVSGRPTQIAQKRLVGEAIPEYHAVLLQQAMTAVQKTLHEEKVDETRAELARAIAPLERERARQVLDTFKKYPDRPVDEVVSMALATVNLSVTLPAATARRLDSLMAQEGQGNLDNALQLLIEQAPVPDGEEEDSRGYEGNDDFYDFNSPEGVEAYDESFVRKTADGLERENRALQEELEQERASRPLDLPEEPVSVQHRNKTVWNLNHFPIKADFYTIGYSGRSVDQFLDILKAAGISTVVDIRHSPVSQYKPDFSKENLRSHLEAQSIQYVHRQDLGIPRGVRADIVGNADRSELWQWYDTEVSPSIDANLVTSYNGSGQKVAFMCVELDPTACHRHRLFLALESGGLRGYDL